MSEDYRAKLQDMRRCSIYADVDGVLVCGSHVRDARLCHALFLQAMTELVDKLDEAEHRVVCCRCAKRKAICDNCGDKESSHYCETCWREMLDEASKFAKLHVKCCNIAVELHVAAEAKLARARKAIADQAAHDQGCPTIYNLSLCTCWIKPALADLGGDDA